MNFFALTDALFQWPDMLIVVGVGLFLSAFFSGSETGYMSVSRVRLLRSGRHATKRGRTLMNQMRNLEDPIMTCLIGTNLSNVLVTVTVTAVLTAALGPRGEWVSLLVVSTVVILLGEILPKVLYREYPEAMTLAAVPGLTVAMILFWPLRLLLRGYSTLLKSLVPFKDEGGGRFSRSNVSALLLSNRTPVNWDQQFALAMDRYLELSELTLGPIMHRISELTTVGPDTTVGACLEVAAASGYSRIPVTRPDGQELSAYVLVRDLLFLPLTDHDRPVPHGLWHSFLQVDVRMSPYELFEELRSRGRQLAVVVDPGGNPLGMITLEDLIEAVIGSISDEFDPADPVRLKESVHE